MRHYEEIDVTAPSWQRTNHGKKTKTKDPPHTMRLHAEREMTGIVKIFHR